MSGPQILQPGAPNQYLVQTRTPSNQAAAARLSVRVVNTRKDVVYEQKDLASAGDYRLELPPTLPLRPNEKLALEVEAQREGGASGKVREELTLARPLYVTHLATDKPAYRPGETIHFRSLTLDRFTLHPAHEDLRLVYAIANPNGEEIFHLEGLSQLAAAQGAPVLGPDLKRLEGIGAGEHHLDPNLKGGEYTLTVREASGRFGYAWQASRFRSICFESKPGQSAVGWR